MADIIRLRGSQHEQVQELLPWYVNGTLDAEESDMVEEHLADCADCRADLAIEEKVAVEIARLPPDLDDSWERMEQRLDKESRPASVSRLPLWRRRVPVGWAVASPLAAAAAVALVFVNVTPRQAPEAQYRALGATEVAQTANVIVLFEPEAREQEIRGALASAEARVVDGPTVTGAYMLKVDDSKREQALKSLRDDVAIALAEPIDGPSIR